MKMNKFIDMGKEKVKNGQLKEQFNELNNTYFEILGVTKADYYGRTRIEQIKKMYDNQDDIYKLKFYKYANLALEECTFGEACSTSEYKKDNVFIFSEAPEKERLFYVVQVI